MPSAAVALSRAHVGVATSFALAGFAFASWASRIPDTSVALSLGPRGLGLLLLVGSAGSVLALPLSGWVVSHLGTARTVRYGAMLALGALAVVGLAVSVLHSVAATGAALFGATYVLGRVLVPEGSGRQLWLMRLYLQLGSTDVLRQKAWLAASVIVLFAIEAMARKQLVRFAVLVATFLVFGSVALVVTAELINDWRLVVAVVLGFAAAALLFLNVRELLRD